MATSLLDIKDATDSSKKHAKTLNFLLFRIIGIDKKCLYTLMHDAFSKHLQLEKFANELDQTETLSFGLLRSVVLVRIYLFSSAFLSLGIGSFFFQCSRPAAAAASRSKSC